MKIVLPAALVAALLLPQPVAGQPAYPVPVEGDFIARNVTFESGEVAPEIRLHYRTVGTPRKDADGVVRNGVLIRHGTGGSGRGFLSDGYAGRLFGRGQLLDAERFSSSCRTTSGTGSRAGRATASGCSSRGIGRPTWCDCSTGW